MSGLVMPPVYIMRDNWNDREGLIEEKMEEIQIPAAKMTSDHWLVCTKIIAHSNGVARLVHGYICRCCVAKNRPIPTG